MPEMQRELGQECCGMRSRDEVCVLVSCSNSAWWSQAHAYAQAYTSLCSGSGGQVLLGQLGVPHRAPRGPQSL